MFKEGMARLFGQNKNEVNRADQETENLPKNAVEIENNQENEQNQFNFEVAQSMIEKSPGKGEDRTIIFDNGKMKIYGVLDGMGGQEGGGGDVAAQIVSEAFQKLMADNENDLSDANETEINKKLTKVILEADKALKSSPTTGIYEKMGTTFTAMVCHDKRVSVVSIGDSKAYRLREGKLEQLNYEDSALYILKKNGYDINMGILSVVSDGGRHDITLNEAIHSLKRDLSSYTSEESQQEGDKNVAALIKMFGNKTLKELRNISFGGIAVGENPPAVHVRTFDVQDGDEYFVTSDGLTDNCLDTNIENGLNKARGMSSEQKAQELANYAKKMQDRTVHPDANKPDDISIVYFMAEKNGEVEEINEADMEEVGT